MGRKDGICFKVEEKKNQQTQETKASQEDALQNQIIWYAQVSPSYYFVLFDSSFHFPYRGPGLLGNLDGDPFSPRDGPLFLK
jgi:hypothetical protein